MDPKSNEDLPKKKASDEEILELAKKELLRDVKCASLRAEQFGAHSWAKPQNYVPSKRFLKNLLVSASRDNDRRKYQTDRRRKHARRTYNNHERDREEYISKNSKKNFVPSYSNQDREDHVSKRKNKKDFITAYYSEHDEERHVSKRKSDKDFSLKKRKMK